MIRTPEELTNKLKDTLGANLKTAVLFGSGAAEDRTRTHSNYNVLVIVQEMNMGTLKQLGPIARLWVKAGNPPPLLFTEDRIRQAEDVFPIEFLDIKASHRVLYGSDPFPALQVHTGRLRHQLEYELRGKLIQLRQRYMEADGNRRAVEELLQKSLSTFAALFKGVLRLLGQEPPSQRAQVFAALKSHVAIDEAALRQILDLRDGKSASQSADELFAGLLTSVESVIDFVNDHNKKESV